MRLIKKHILCNYYLTYRCNAKCSFCDIWERPSPFVKAENVERNLYDLKKLGVKVIDFTGGEPLLHPDVALFCAMAKKLGFITTLTTNAMRYERFAEQLRGKVDMLHFSLDAADAATHNRLRGVACFDTVMAAIKTAKDLGERPDIIFTVSDSNMSSLEDIWRTICVKNDLVLLINPIFSYNSIDNQGGLSTENIHILQKEWLKRPLVYLNNAFLELRKAGGNQILSPICKAGSSTVVISPENKLILPCYHLGLDEIPIENNLYALYQTKKVQDLIALEGKMPACAACVINCYMQPSFAVELNRYWFLALPSTVKYNMMKATWKSLFR